MSRHDGKLQWHPAFSAALRIELENELDILDIKDEYLLSHKPMQMDILVIKKEKSMDIQKNIGRIFRKHNIIEYKAPDDYLSINDFYKVYGYTCFYQSDTQKTNMIVPNDLTITFVCNHYPHKMLKHLKEFRNIHTQKQEAGIYYLHGDSFPMQLLVTKELSRKENYWLQSLRNNLKAGAEIQELMERYEAKKHSSYHQAAMNLIVRANWEQMKEEKEMCDALRELFADELKESEEHGIHKGILTGQAQGIALAKNIFKLAADGVSSSEIAAKCGISESRVKEILD